MSHIKSKGEKTFPDKDFSYDSAMTLTLDLETWFQVTAQPLQKVILWVKYGQIGPMGEKICSG